ncbi:coiled-coil domain-containing protein 97 [Phaenicophaeus curvirostris]|uniref:coiled-coil domain-containing protein 97 n=1 Tax=Phaenicophaeus curvirostris TaxID=33595 RepID=UPI0037F0DB4B
MLHEDPKTSDLEPEMNEDPETSPEDPETSRGDPETSALDPERSGDPETSPGAPQEARLKPPERGVWGRPRRSPARTRLRNRRYAALRQLIQEGEYFSEEEMRAREPLLYHHYIGRYRGAEPLLGDPPAPPNSWGGGPPQVSGTPPSLTELLLRSVEEAAVQQRLRRQRLREGEAEEEEEEDLGSPPSPPERALLRQEFTSRMHQRFLDGCDPHFDYSQVDENPDLDNLDLVSRDAEERYFDAEEPSAAPRLD